MSNSVVFLLIAVGLSVLGTLAVWLHGRPRRSRSSVEMFSRSLQALAANDHHPREPLSGVTIRRPDSPPVDDQYIAPAAARVIEDPADAAPADPDAFSGDAVSGDAVSGDETIPTRARRQSPRPGPRPAPRVNPRPGGSRAASSHEGVSPGS